MDFKPKKHILKYSHESAEIAKQRINLGRPGEMEKVVEILRNWIAQQPHFKRKEFSKNYLEMCILGAKGSTERAKSLIDKLCTFRTLLPKYFQTLDEKDLDEVFEVVTPVVLPNYSKDHYRVFIMKFWGDIKKSSQLTKLHKNTVNMAEYMMHTDSVSGVHICLDLSDTNILELVSNQNLIELKDISTIFMEAYGMRIKGIHLITTSKLIDAFIAIIKQVLKPKLISRIHVYKSWTELHGIIGKDILPREFGGMEKCIREIHEEWLNEMSSEEFKKFLRERNFACTDESLRPKDQFNSEYAGMPGSFRALIVD